MVEWSIGVYPKQLKIGDRFSIRGTTNAKKFVVNGPALKICRENGFTNFHSEDHGKVRVPVENHPAGEIILHHDVHVFMWEVVGEPTGGR